MVNVDVATVDSAVDNEESVETTVFSSVADVTVDMTKIIKYYHIIFFKFNFNLI